jgi:hypothetical protein
MGDRIAISHGLRLRLGTPLPGTIRILRNGTIIAETNGHGTDLTVTETGVYRAEIWLPIDGELRPWIYSNPIRIF